MGRTWRNWCRLTQPLAASLRPHHASKQASPPFAEEGGAPPPPAPRPPSRSAPRGAAPSTDSRSAHPCRSPCSTTGRAAPARHTRCTEATRAAAAGVRRARPRSSRWRHPDGPAAASWSRATPATRAASACRAACSSTPSTPAPPCSRRASPRSQPRRSTTIACRRADCAQARRGGTSTCCSPTVPLGSTDRRRCTGPTRMCARLTGSPTRPTRQRGSTTRRRASRQPTSSAAGSASTHDEVRTRRRPNCGCVGDSGSCLPPPYSAIPADRLRHSLLILPRPISPRSSTATPQSRAARSLVETPWHPHPSAPAWWTRGRRCATVATEKASSRRAELYARSAYPAPTEPYVPNANVQTQQTQLRSGGARSHTVPCPHSRPDTHSPRGPLLAPLSPLCAHPRGPQDACLKTVPPTLVGSSPAAISEPTTSESLVSGALARAQ